MGKDLAWAAGLFEGEGCFTVGPNGPTQTIASASLAMSDEDVVRRFADIMGFGKVDIQRPADPRNKMLYRWRVRRFEFVQATIAMLWSRLGNRRRARAKEVLQTMKGN